ncbi:MAG: hypothetical protein Q4C53_06960 [Clostridia bacterium]|nr:hypothetical protein [Clostridia bacterium]
MNLCAALPPFLWVAAFLTWILTGRKKELYVSLGGALLLFLAALATYAAISALRNDGVTALAAQQMRFLPKSRADRPQKRHPAGRILLLAFLSRLILFFGLYAVDMKVNGYHGGLFEMPVLFAPLRFATPAAALLGLPASEVLLQSNLARFPLFPLLANALGKYTVSPVFAGCIISNLCVVLAAPLLYEHVLAQGTTADGKRAVLWLLLGPAAVVTLFANEASLVLMLSLAALYASRRSKCFSAAVFAFAAILTHPIALILLIPLLWDRISAIVLATQLKQTLSPLKTSLRLLFATLPLLAIGVPDLIGRMRYGVSAPLTEGLSLFFFAEEPAGRLAQVLSEPIDGLAAVARLLPFLLVLLLLLTALHAARTMRPQDLMSLLCVPFVFSVMSVRASVALTVAAWPLLTALPLLTRYRPLREIAAVAGVLCGAAFYLCYAAGRLPF